MKTVSTKTNSRRQRKGNEPAPGMRKTGTSYTASIITKGMAEKQSEASSHKEIVTGKDEGDRAKPHRLPIRKKQKNVNCQGTELHYDIVHKGQTGIDKQMPKQSMPGMRETGPSHTKSIIPQGLRYICHKRVAIRRH